MDVVPDILWIRRRSPETDLINPKSSVEYEIHVIDVKMAAEPNLRHFAEVTFYTLALSAALEEQGLSDRYAVSAEGLIFPGSHDQHEFRRLCQDFAAKGSTDAVADALTKTLIGVPHEVYQTHVRDFLRPACRKFWRRQLKKQSGTFARKVRPAITLGFAS